MKTIAITFFLLIVIVPRLLAQRERAQIITTDLENYWLAYDQIIQSQDSLERLKLLRDLYIDKGSPGLKGLITVRRYQDQEFVDNMLNYQSYWNSIRGNTAYITQSTVHIEKYLER